MLRGITAAAVGLLALGLALPAVAEGEDERIHVIEHLDVDPPPGAQGNRPANGTLYLNPQARHGYQVFMLQSLEMFIRTIHLDTLEVIGEFTVPVRFVTPGGRATPAEYIVSVDEERDLLYAAYEDQTGWAGIVRIDAIRQRYETFSVNDATDPLRMVADPNCRGRTSQSCQPQLTGVNPYNPLAIDFVDPFLTGLTPKILVLLQEPNCPGCENNSNIAWLLQWDADTGHQDWYYRLQSCNTARFPWHPTSRYNLALFQARVGSGIYLGCDVSGGTGQAIRLTTDAANVPFREEAFPGPTNVADVMSDADDDRLIFRVVNEEGESYWVFNGSASSYSGVVGATLSQVSTAAGIDPGSGRMYVMAPASTLGGQSSPGGLMLSDIRRSPAPQGLLFPQFSQGGFHRIVVDPAAPRGTRRVFFRQQGRGVDRYLVLQDDVPITVDPPLTDLDRFTVDVEEEVGKTDVNFTATGHAYGFRYNFVGGIEGIPPGGPSASGIRLGRSIPRWSGTPCGPAERRLSVGYVRQAQYSNNIMSAASTAGDPDPSTQTDTGEPTARCYPYPRQVASLKDPFYPVFGENYPRPLDTQGDEGSKTENTERDARTDTDELVGNDWPFHVAECSSEGADESRTTLRPLDRDIDHLQGNGLEPDRQLPKDVREHPVDPEGFYATVECRGSKGFVRSEARARSFRQEAGEHTPLIEIAEASSNVHLYLDPDRGLVARSEAIVRGLRIGLPSDRLAGQKPCPSKAAKQVNADSNACGPIYIDAAITVAEAWAHGRPGTAATSFSRRLCGVRLPDSKHTIDVIDLDAPAMELPEGAPQEARDLVGTVDPLDEGTDDQRVDGVDTQGCGESPVAIQANPAGVGQYPIVDVINRILGSRGRASVPTPDAELRQGTAGGYLASLQKDRLEQISARSVNNDESTQVPALEIIVFNDDPQLGRGRQLYQIAGVDASVTYGIYLLNPLEFGNDGPVDFGPLTPGPDFPVAPPPATDGPLGAPPVATGSGGPLTMVFKGLELLLRSPKDMLLAAGIWGILYSPVQLSFRRRALRGLA